MKCTLVHTECGKDVGEIMKIAAMKSVANKFHNPRVAFLTGSKLNCTALATALGTALRSFLAALSSS